MVSLATYERLDPDHLAVFSPTIIRDMLRGDLGFRGVVISDALGATAVASIAPATRAIDFVQAGGDMIISNQVPPAIEMAQALADRAATQRRVPSPDRRRGATRPRGQGRRRPAALRRLTSPRPHVETVASTRLIDDVISTNEQRATPAAS